ncbi:35869_t:CDS:1, partial [Gigaspora margarita]
KIQAQNSTKTQSPATNIQSSNITKEILLLTQFKNNTIVHSDFTAEEIKKYMQKFLFA